MPEKEVTHDMMMIGKMIIEDELYQCRLSSAAERVDAGATSAAVASSVLLY